VPGAPPRTSTLATAPASREDHRAARRPLGQGEVADLDARDGGQGQVAHRRTETGAGLSAITIAAMTLAAIVAPARLDSSEPQKLYFTPSWMIRPSSALRIWPKVAGPMVPLGCPKPDLVEEVEGLDPQLQRCGCEAGRGS
jgi:hypothetical protein